MAKIFTFILLTAFVSQSSLQLDLESLCQDMWDKTGENLNVPLELTFNRPKSKTDPLFKLTATGKAIIGSSIVFKTFKELLSDPRVTSRQKGFLNAIMKEHGPVKAAFKYLVDKQHIPKTVTKAEFQSMLRDMWFAGPGFLHVFVGDKVPDTQKYQGLHNWYQYYLEQRKKAIELMDLNSITFNYNTEPNFIKQLDFKWGSLEKFVGPSSMFVGTSPEFEFALFSVCFLAQKGLEQKICTCNIHNSQLTLRVIEKTFNPGRLQTAYPTGVKADDICTGNFRDRTNCGYDMIDHYNCVKRGCCFDSNPMPMNKNWCFYPSNHKCHGIRLQNRQACGLREIDMDKCELQGCCFDLKNEPFCFYGNPQT